VTLTSIRPLVRPAHPPSLFWDPSPSLFFLSLPLPFLLGGGAGGERGGRAEGEPGPTRGEGSGAGLEPGVQWVRGPGFGTLLFPPWGVGGDLHLNTIGVQCDRLYLQEPAHFEIVAQRPGHPTHHPDIPSGSA
jgi:hypothetical protein